MDNKNKFTEEELKQIEALGIDPNKVVLLEIEEIVCSTDLVD